MNNVITNYLELLLRIEHLRMEKNKQEEELKNLFSEFVNTLNPISMIKESLHHLAVDKQVKVDFVKVGLNMGATFLIDLVFGRHRSIKGFLSSEIAGKISPLLINSNVTKIFPALSKWIPQKEGQNHI